MLRKTHSLVQLARTYGQRFFLHFGIHCATHQIRVILISSVVITSLFYPALASYYSSPDSSWSVWTNLLGAYSTIPNSNDVVEVWSGLSSLQSREDRLSRLSCGSGRTLRLERLLIQSPVQDDDSALNQAILFRTHAFQHALDGVIQARQLPCLKTPTNPSCFSISPLAFWDFDQATLSQDTNILDTLALTRNATISGVAINPAMVLAGRGSLDPHASPSDFDYASYLVLTYFFDSDCLSKSEHITWIEAVREAASSSDELQVFPEQSALVSLEFKSEPQGWTALSFTLALAYGGFFLYVLWSMKRMKAVHSRFGITFTALVEIAVSTITSMSLLLLVGFKITLVPWELLPVVIMFVGAENMTTLVDAVTSTPVTIAVKDRIAQGLSRAGTSNSLKLVSYNSILGILGFFSVGATRQFCVFAIVVLVAHWFLAHTFFVTVLSIDLARLELDELLSQNVNSSPSSAYPDGKKPNGSAPMDTSVSKLKNVLKSRATKNISLVLLLTIAATLYYLTYPSTLPSSPHSNPPPKGALSRFQNNTRTHTQSPPEKRLWDIFNPRNETPFHLRIEAPSLLTFHQNSGEPLGPENKEFHKPRLSRLRTRTMQLFWWSLKIMVLPIGLTTTALWLLTMYLLKDTDRLDAQKHRMDSSEATRDLEKSLEDKMRFTTAPRAFTSDIELISANKDGSVIASVGILNELVIHWTDSNRFVPISAGQTVQRGVSSSQASSTIVAVAVDWSGQFCAVGTGAGVVAVWSISETSSRFLTSFSVEESSAGVSELRFLPDRIQRMDVSQPSALLVVYENGLVIRFQDGNQSVVHPSCPASGNLLYASLLPHDHIRGQFVVGFVFDDGTVDIINPVSSTHIASVTDTDRVVHMHVCQAADHDPSHLVMATASDTGKVCVWDLSSKDLLVCLDDPYLRISQLRICANTSRACHVCGQSQPAWYTLALSAGGIVQVFAVFPPSEGLTMQCSCIHTRPRAIVSSARHSRSASVSSTRPGSPSMLRRKLSLTMEGSSFPVSGHGLHSRRSSEKESSRRLSEGLIDDFDPRRQIGESLGPPSVKRGTYSLVMEMDLQRGGWDLHQGFLLGIRRALSSNGSSTSHRRPFFKDSSNGLSRATMERWEAWKYDPAADIQSSSTLALLYSLPTSSSRAAKSVLRSEIPRLPFTRITPFITRESFALSGLGNTVGILREL